MTGKPTSLAMLAVGVALGAAAVFGAMTMFAPGPQTGSGGPSGPRGPFGGGPGGESYAPVVAMAVAERATVDHIVEAIGEARALRSVTLASEVTGLVTAVNFAPGKRLREGDLMLQVDDKEQRIALAKAEAQYPIAKANAERYRALREDGAASAIEAETAFNEFQTIEAELRAARFALEQRAVRAPFDGIAGLTTIEAGDYIRAGDVITTLDDTSSMIIEFAVPQESASDVDIGLKVTAELASGGLREFEGVVTAIDTRVDAASRTLRVEAVFENPEQRIIPGAVFLVELIAPGEPAVLVPGLALQWDRDGAYLWKRGPDGAAVRAPVRVLQRRDDLAIVEGEIEPGDQVASAGADRVRADVPLPAAQDVDRGHGSGVAAGAARP